MEEMQSPQEAEGQKTPAANTGPVPEVTPEKNPSPKKKGGFMKILIVILILAIAGGAAALYFLGGDEDQPPSLEMSGSKFQGQSIGDQIGALVYEQSDVDGFNEPSNAQWTGLPKGVNHIYAKNDISIEDLVDNHIKPKDGLRIFVADYKPQDSNFYLYPTNGPYAAEEINEASAYEIPAGKVFSILASDEFEINANIINDSDTFSDSNYLNDFIGRESGWYLLGLPENYVDISDQVEVLSFWVQTGQNSFDKVTDLSSPDLSKSIAWFKLGDPITASDDQEEEDEEEEVVDEEEEVVDEEEEVVDEEEEVVDDEEEVVDDEEEVVDEEEEVVDEEEEVVDDEEESERDILLSEDPKEILKTDRDTLLSENQKEVLSSGEEDFVDNSDATEKRTVINKLEYVDSLEDVFTTDSSNWQEYMKGNNIFGNVNDHSARVIMAALKVYIDGDADGFVKLDDIAFRNHGYASYPTRYTSLDGTSYRPEIDRQPIENYKTAEPSKETALMEFCNGKGAWEIHVYYQKYGVLHNKTIYRKEDMKSEFNSDEITTSPSTDLTVFNDEDLVDDEDIEIPAGYPTIITLEMVAPFDHCAHEKLKEEFGADAVATSEADFTSLAFELDTGRTIRFPRDKISNDEEHDHWINWIDPDWVLYIDTDFKLDMEFDYI